MRARTLLCAAACAAVLALALPRLALSWFVTGSLVIAALATLTFLQLQSPFALYRIHLIRQKYKTRAGIFLRPTTPVIRWTTMAWVVATTFSLATAPTGLSPIIASTSFLATFVATFCPALSAWATAFTAWTALFSRGSVISSVKATFC